MNEKIFYNYQRLLAKVNEFCSGIIKKYGKEIKCSLGCIDCCQQNLSLFPVEFFFLQQGFKLLPPREKTLIQNRIVNYVPEKSSCILLEKGICLLYEYRPIICRTQGLPLLVTENEIIKKDCCPKNFSFLRLNSLPQFDFLHLERLNTILVVVNQEFASHHNIEAGKRISITDLYRLDLNELISQA